MHKYRVWSLAVGMAILVTACGGAPSAPGAGEEAGVSSAESSAGLARPVTTGTFVLTGSMDIDRQEHAATLLADGRVLVTGGRGTSRGRTLKFHASAELYDPAAAAWSSTGSMSHDRAYHTATLLRDGNVLVVGNKGTKTSPEIYDPAAGTWATTGDTAEPRGEHKTTLLRDGRVLITGGRNTRLQHLVSTEMYDPSTGTWSSGPDMADERANHTATLLEDGRVLIAGSDVTLGGLVSAEVFDPATGALSPTGSTTEGRSFNTATLLEDGRVLVTGGEKKNSAETYDPATGAWSTAGKMEVLRAEHAAALLDDGRVLVVGGWADEDKNEVWESSELYDPRTNTWAAGGTTDEPRFRLTATRLQDGRVLIAGGQGKKKGSFYTVGVDIWQSTELYSP